MILDGIIGLLVSLFGIVLQGAAMVLVPTINLVAAGIEAVVGIFVTGFQLGRIERGKREEKSQSSNEPSASRSSRMACGQGKARSPVEAIGGLLFLVIIFGVIAWVFVGPGLMNRTVTLVAKDGHSLPFAAMIVHTNNGDRHLRTDNAGNIVIPRFGTTALTVKDPRYVEQTWTKSEIEPELTVGRSVLGSGLDSLAERLLKPKPE